MRVDDLVVDGNDDKGEVRRTIAGLRLLVQYGKVAEAALRALRSDTVDMVVPTVHRMGRSRDLTVSKVPVHRSAQIPPLPDYSAVNAFLKPVTKGPGYTVYVRGPQLWVSAWGKVVTREREVVVGSVWFTKTRTSWNFQNDGGPVKKGKDVQCRALARSAALMLVTMQENGPESGDGFEVKHSMARHVLSTLRKRAEAVLLLDGHAKRLREQSESGLSVEEVHSR